MFTKLELLSLALPAALAAFMFIRYPRKIVLLEFTVIMLLLVALLFVLKASNSFDVVRDAQFRTVPIHWAAHRERYTSTRVGLKTNPMSGKQSMGLKRTAHPERFCVNARGEEYSIEQQQYEALRERWGNPIEKDHTEFVTWPGDLESAEFLTVKEEWCNRLQFTRRGMDYPSVAAEDQQRLRLYSYPIEDDPRSSPRHHFAISPILGASSASHRKAERALSALNAQRAASGPQFWILLFPGLPEEAGNLQEALWQGGNGNEFVVCLGLDAEQGENFPWVHCFTWSAAEKLAEDAQAQIEKLEPASLDAVVSLLDTSIGPRWTPPPDPGIPWYAVPVRTVHLVLVYVSLLVACCLALQVAYMNGIEQPSEDDEELRRAA